MAEDYAVVLSDRSWSDPGWKEVAEALERKHKGRLIRFSAEPSEALPALQQFFPRYVCFVAPPQEANRAFVAEVRRLTRAIDDDPFTDCRWGILTGYDAANALRIAKHSKPLEVRRIVSGTPIPLDGFEEGVWFSELKAGQIVRKEKGKIAVEEKGPQDSTKGLVDSLNDFRPDVFVTSGHATEHEWQIGFRYRNGYFRCAQGNLFGEDITGRKLTISSPNPKVYLAVGNCLMGHVAGPDAMALAFMNGGGATQMIGYTVNTWYGYAGWGCLDYFVEQPGRYTLAEAALANDIALVHRLQTYFPGLVSQKLDLDGPRPPKVELSDPARRDGLTAQDGFGLLYDRDTLAFYGDPAWEARLSPATLAWDQSLAERDGTWTLELKPRLGERSFSPRDTNGSQRGRRPFIHFLPRRIGQAEVLEGADLQPVIADNFILVPNPGKCDPARTYRVAFKAANLR